MTRYFWTKVETSEGKPGGVPLSDFEGFVEPATVEETAQRIWVEVIDYPPEDDEKLWWAWLHYVHETENVANGCDDNVYREVLVALRKFLGKDAGVFLVP